MRIKLLIIAKYSAINGVNNPPQTTTKKQINSNIFGQVNAVKVLSEIGQ